MPCLRETRRLTASTGAQGALALSAGSLKLLVTQADTTAT